MVLRVGVPMRQPDKVAMTVHCHKLVQCPPSAGLVPQPKSTASPFAGQLVSSDSTIVVVLGPILLEVRTSDELN